MAKKLDVYRDWLSITETARPLNHYQLLKLKVFEDDTAKIRASYRQLNAHVRRYATGDYSSESQALLNELTKAMLCLTDAQRKREYDITQGRKDQGEEGRRRSLEEILLANKVLTSDQLAKARALSSTLGLEIRDAVLQQRLATQDVVMQAYAESQGRSYLDPASDIAIDEVLTAQVPAAMVRTHSCVPVAIDDGRVLVASPKPLDPGLEDRLRLQFGVPVWWVVCTPRSLNEAIDKHYSREAMAAAAAKLAAAKHTAKTAKPAAKAAPAKPAAAPKPAKASAEEAPAGEATEQKSSGERLKQVLMIAWIVIVGVAIVYMFKKMVF